MCNAAWDNVFIGRLFPLPWTKMFGTPKKKTKRKEKFNKAPKILIST